MKRIAVFLLCVMLTVVTYGQNETGQGKEVYALVTVWATTSRVEAQIDFGDGNKALFFADEKGHRRKFASFFEPINMLIKNGWKIEQYTLYITNSCQAIMKKKVNEDSEVKEGMKLKEE